MSTNKAKREAEEAVRNFIRRQISETAYAIKNGKREINAISDNQRKRKKVMAELLWLQRAIGDGK